MVCHLKCTLAFDEDSSKLLSCEINKKTICKVCGCPVLSHTHARIEYFTVKKETEAYKLIVSNIHSVKKTQQGKTFLSIIIKNNWMNTTENFVRNRSVFTKNLESIENYLLAQV